VKNRKKKCSVTVRRASGPELSPAAKNLLDKSMKPPRPECYSEETRGVVVEGEGSGNAYT